MGGAEGRGRDIRIPSWWLRMSGGGGITEFRVEAVELDGHAELRLAGELDIETAPHLAQALQPMYERAFEKIVLDISQVTFIDSSGLRELVMALRRQREDGRDVVLRAPSENTLRVLEIVGLTDVFTIA